MLSLRVAVLTLVTLVGTAVADPSERTDRSRLYQMIPVAAGGTVYLVLELGLKDAITPDHCRWCESNAFDTAARSALLWDNVRLANSLSNYTGYLGNPLLATGLLIATSAGDDGSDTTRRIYDDLAPVFQAGIVTGVLNQTIKVIAGRRRPFAQFGGVAVRAKNDVNTSFFSGHTALAFTMATSSGTVASLRGYRSAPVLWIGGLTLATATGYLRIAGDAHYATDVIAGAVVGAAIGILIPLVFHHDVLTDEGPAPRQIADREPFMFSFGTAF
ncbi:MAG: hypothetical protein JWP01_1205 [Myxococcales bacterium]|nr:hypothetical protein [Myxococcales bacterium]